MIYIDISNIFDIKNMGYTPCSRKQYHNIFDIFENIRKYAFVYYTSFILVVK